MVSNDQGKKNQTYTVKMMTSTFTEKHVSEKSCEELYLLLVGLLPSQNIVTPGQGVLS